MGILSFLSYLLISPRRDTKQKISTQALTAAKSPVKRSHTRISTLFRDTREMMYPTRGWRSARYTRQRSKIMANSLMQTVTRVVDRGLKTNSYKLALLRSLVAIACRSNSAPLRVTRFDLAEQFVERYWPLALLFRVRQATVPDKDPIVMRLIRKEQARLMFPDTISVRVSNKLPRRLSAANRARRSRGL
jgi:hypothetical protein